MDIGKQCRPRSDATERGVLSTSRLFALNTGISIKHGNDKYLIKEMNLSKDLNKHTPHDTNGLIFYSYLFI